MNIDLAWSGLNERLDPSTLPHGGFLRLRHERLCGVGFREKHHYCGKERQSDENAERYLDTGIHEELAQKGAGRLGNNGTDYERKSELPSDLGKVV
jgi:hypothetical protein